MRDPEREPHGWLGRFEAEFVRDGKNAVDHRFVADFSAHALAEKQEIEELVKFVQADPREIGRIVQAATDVLLELVDEEGFEFGDGHPAFRFGFGHRSLPQLCSIWPGEAESGHCLHEVFALRSDLQIVLLDSSQAGFFNTNVFVDLLLQMAFQLSWESGSGRGNRQAERAGFFLSLPFSCIFFLTLPSPESQVQSQVGVTPESQVGVTEESQVLTHS